MERKKLKQKRKKTSLSQKEKKPFCGYIEIKQLFIPSEKMSNPVAGLFDDTLCAVRPKNWNGRFTQKLSINKKHVHVNVSTHESRLSQYSKSNGNGDDDGNGKGRSTA